MNETHLKKNFVLDSTTFGNTKACLVLVDFMNVNKNGITVDQKHKILSIIYNFCDYIKSLKDLKKHQHCDFFSRYLLESTNKAIDLLDVDVIYKTYMKNIIKAKHKVFAKSRSNHIVH